MQVLNVRNKDLYKTHRKGRGRVYFLKGDEEFALQGETTRKRASSQDKEKGVFLTTTLGLTSISCT